MMNKKHLIGSISVVAAIIALGTVAYAANPVATANISSGSLTITPPTMSSDFGTIVMDGTVKTANATLSSWTVDDASGTGAGWHVTVQASQFTETGGLGYTLPLGSLARAGTRTITAGSGASAVDATNGPLIQNPTAPIDVASAVTTIDTLAGYGMGTYTVNEPANGLALTLNPSTTKVDKTNYPAAPTPYTSTITYTIVSGP